MELFAQRTGTQLTHVPYPGGAAAVTDLLAGRLQLSFLNLAVVAPHVGSGALRAVAVGSPARHPLLPEVPAVAETLPGFEGGSWHSLVAPRGTPDPLAERIHDALAAALRLPETTERLSRIGFTVEASSRAELGARIAGELAGWGEVVRRAGLATG
jgi:tripartite-type tricarboxylate transporter receptor subunit TctC